jgi:hypothetical protein
MRRMQGVWLYVTIWSKSPAVLDARTQQLLRLILQTSELPS